MRTIYCLFMLVVGFLFSGNNEVVAQKVFSTQYKSDAEVKVYVAQYRSDADLIVHKCSSKGEVSGNGGLWFFVEYKSEADKKIFFTQYKSEADVIIFFSSFKSEAGWKNNAKKHFFY